MVNCKKNKIPLPVNRILSLWHQPTPTFEDVLSKQINWWRTLFFFGFNGILYVHVVMKAGGYYDVSSGIMFFATTMTMIHLGILYGIISNLIVGLLIKLTGRFFGASNDLRTIYNAMTWAYLPASICVVLLLLNLFIAKSLLTDPATVPDLILSALVIIFSFIQFFLGFAVHPALQGPESGTGTQQDQNHPELCFGGCDLRNSQRCNSKPP